MKSLILSTVVAAALALSAGTALASSNSSDNGFAVYQESLSAAPSADRQFLSSGADYDQDTAGHGTPQASSSPHAGSN